MPQIENSMRKACRHFVPQGYSLKGNTVAEILDDMDRHFAGGGGEGGSGVEYIDFYPDEEAVADNYFIAKYNDEVIDVHGVYNLIKAGKTLCGRENFFLGDATTSYYRVLSIVEIEEDNFIAVVFAQTMDGVYTEFSITTDGNSYRESNLLDVIPQPIRLEVIRNDDKRKGYEMLGWSTYDDLIAMLTNGDYLAVFYNNKVFPINEVGEGTLKFVNTSWEEDKLFVRIFYVYEDDGELVVELAEKSIS